MNQVLVDKNIEVFNTSSMVVAYPPLENALLAWADTTTDPTSDRREDLLHEKKKASTYVEAFFVLNL